MTGLSRNVSINVVLVYVFKKVFRHKFTFQCFGILQIMYLNGLILVGLFLKSP